MAVRMFRKDTDQVREPWRKSSDWNKKSLEKLMDEIVNLKPTADPDITHSRILMIGPVGAGKSSFYNTMNSIFRGRITQPASSGSTAVSLTSNYTTYTVKNGNGSPLNFRLCDTRGMEESKGLDENLCSCLLNGNIPNHYEFTPDTKTPTWKQGYIRRPTANDRIHCVVFVLDATTIDVLSKDLIANMKLFQRLAMEKGLPQVIVLTKVDKLCKDVKKDISFVHTSSMVEKQVDKAAELLGLTRANVFPLKNYENEVQLDDNVSILALLALRQILYFTEDYTGSRIDRERAADAARWTIPHIPYCTII